MTSGPRLVRAARGSELTCRGWQQEAALRMLMNNLDPEVAENPDSLVVYGGTARGRRHKAPFGPRVPGVGAPAGDEVVHAHSGQPGAGFLPHEVAPPGLVRALDLVR